MRKKIIRIYWIKWYTKWYWLFNTKKIYKDGKVDCKELKPHIVTSNYYYYNNVDTDIQNNNEKFDFSSIDKKEDNYDISTNLLEQFLFIKGLDQLNNDAYYSKDNNYIMMQKCLNDDNVVGFNNIGFFKKEIDFVNLEKSNYFSLDGGLYIKKKY